MSVNNDIVKCQKQTTKANHQGFRSPGRRQDQNKYRENTIADISQLYYTNQINPDVADIFDQFKLSDYGFKSTVRVAEKIFTKVEKATIISDKPATNLDISQHVDINAISIYNIVNGVADSPTGVRVITETYSDVKNFFKYYCNMKLSYTPENLNYERIDFMLGNKDETVYEDVVDNYYYRCFSFDPLDAKPRIVKNSTFYFISRAMLPTTIPRYLLDYTRFDILTNLKCCDTLDDFVNGYNEHINLYININQNAALSGAKALVEEYFLNHGNRRTDYDRIKDTFLTNIKYPNKVAYTLIQSMIDSFYKDKASSEEMLILNIALSIIFMDVKNLVPYVMGKESFDTGVLNVVENKKVYDYRYRDGINVLNEAKAKHVENNDTKKAEIADILLNIIENIKKFKQGLISLPMYDQLFKIELLKFVDKHFSVIVTRKIDVSSVNEFVNKFTSITTNPINIPRHLMRSANKYTKQEIIDAIFRCMGGFTNFAGYYFGFLNEFYYKDPNNIEARNMVYNAFANEDYDVATCNKLYSLFLWTLHARDDARYYDLMVEVFKKYNRNIERKIFNTGSFEGHEFFELLLYGEYTNSTVLYKLPEYKIKPGPITDKLYLYINDLYTNIERKGTISALYISDIVDVLYSCASENIRVPKAVYVVEETKKEEQPKPVNTSTIKAIRKQPSPPQNKANEQTPKANEDHNMKPSNDQPQVAKKQIIQQKPSTTVATSTQANQTPAKQAQASRKQYKTNDKFKPYVPSKHVTQQENKANEQTQDTEQHKGELKVASNKQHKATIETGSACVHDRTPPTDKKLVALEARAQVEKTTITQIEKLTTSNENHKMKTSYDQPQVQIKQTTKKHVTFSTEVMNLVAKKYVSSSEAPSQNPSGAEDKKHVSSKVQASLMQAQMKIISNDQTQQNKANEQNTNANINEDHKMKTSYDQTQVANKDVVSGVHDRTLHPDNTLVAMKNDAQATKPNNEQPLMQSQMKIISNDQPQVQTPQVTSSQVQTPQQNYIGFAQLLSQHISHFAQSISFIDYNISNKIMHFAQYVYKFNLSNTNASINEDHNMTTSYDQAQVQSPLMQEQNISEKVIHYVQQTLSEIEQFTQYITFVNQFTQNYNNDIYYLIQLIQYIKNYIPTPHNKNTSNEQNISQKQVQTPQVTKKEVTKKEELMNPQVIKFQQLMKEQEEIKRKRQISTQRYTITYTFTPKKINYETNKTNNTF